MDEKPQVPEWMKHPHSEEYARRMRWGARATALGQLLKARDWTKISNDHDHDLYMEWKYRAFGTTMAMTPSGAILVKLEGRRTVLYDGLADLIDDLMEIEVNLR